MSDRELIEAARSVRGAMIQIGLSLRPLIEDVQAIGRRPIRMSWRAPTERVQPIESCWYCGHYHDEDDCPELREEE